MENTSLQNKLAEDEFELDFDTPPFTKLATGIHFLRISELRKEFKEHQRNAEKGSSGNCLTIIYKTFGNSDEGQNGKQVYQTVPLDGKDRTVLQKIVSAAIPTAAKGTFKFSDLIGKEVEAMLYYNLDNRTNKERDYPNVKNVKTYIAVGSTGSAEDFNKF